MIISGKIHLLTLICLFFSFFFTTSAALEMLMLFFYNISVVYYCSLLMLIRAGCKSVRYLKWAEPSETTDFCLPFLLFGPFSAI